MFRQTIYTPVLLCLLIFSQFCYANESPSLRFEVIAFSISGENPLTAEQTDTVLNPFLGEHQGLEGLLEASEELEAAILNAGFPFNRVILPPQGLEQGRVTLQILPIKLANIEVSGNEHFEEQNILRSLPGLTPGSVPDTRELARQLIVANQHPSKLVTIRLKQSSEIDSIDALLEVRDQRPWQLFSVLNNIGTHDTGRMRLSVGGQHNNLLGFDDSLTASYTTSPGHTSEVKQWGFNYRIPVYDLGGSIDLFYSRSDVDSGTIQNVFDVSGAGKFLGASYTHTFRSHDNYRHRLSLGVDDKRFDNNVSFLGAPIGVDVRSRPMKLNYLGEFQLEKARFRFDLSYVRNLNGGNLNNARSYAASRSGAQQDWDLIRYHAEYSRSLPQSWQLGVKLQGQISNEPLISGEQFGIGGINSVRGFEERQVSGDRGEQFSIMFSRPLLNQQLLLRLFSDYGHIKLRSPAAGQIDSQSLLSAGLGLSWQWRNKLNLAMDYAHELNDGRSANISGNKLHVSLFYRF